MKECLAAASAYDIFAIIMENSQAYIQHKFLPMSIRTISKAQDKATDLWTLCKDVLYPFLSAELRNISSAAVELWKQGTITCAEFWSLHVSPFLSSTIRPGATKIYDNYLDPIISQKILPLYKQHLEPVVDRSVASITAFHTSQISPLIVRYVLPAFREVSYWFHYALYFTVKYFEQDNWFELSLYSIVNLWELTAYSIASVPIVQQVFGPTGSIFFSSGLMSFALLLLLYLLRNVLLAVAAGLIMLLLSPLLAVVFVAAKAVGFFFPTSSKFKRNSTESNNNGTKAAGNVNGVDSSDKPTVRKDGKTVVRREKTVQSRPAQSSVSAVEVDVRRGKALPLPLPLPVAAPYFEERDVRDRVPPRKNSAYNDRSRLIAASPEARYGRSSSGELSGPFSPPWASSPPVKSVGDFNGINSGKSPSAVEKLRNRKSPGAVTLGLTPAAALGIAPIHTEKSPFDDSMFRDDDEEGEDDEAEAGEVPEGQNPENDFSYSDL